MKQEIVTRTAWPGTAAAGWTAGIRTVHDNGSIEYHGYNAKTEAEALARLRESKEGKAFQSVNQESLSTNPKREERRMYVKSNTIRIKNEIPELLEAVCDYPEVVQ